jgi:phage shock protein PspC (stress-responsive transcriptional regulator)
VTQDGKQFDFDQTWVNLAFIVWIAMNGVVHGLILPNERKLGAGEADESVEKKVDLGGMLVTLLFLVMMYLMVFRPGQVGY